MSMFTNDEVSESGTGPNDFGVSTAYAELEKQIKELSDDVDSLLAQVNAKADSSDVTALSSTVGQVSSQVTVNTAAITQLADKVYRLEQYCEHDVADAIATIQYNYSQLSGQVTALQNDKLDKSYKDTVPQQYSDKYITSGGVWSKLNEVSLKDTQQDASINNLSQQVANLSSTKVNKSVYENKVNELGQSITDTANQAKAYTDSKIYDPGIMSPLGACAGWTGDTAPYGWHFCDGATIASLDISQDDKQYLINVLGTNVLPVADDMIIHITYTQE